MWKVKHGQVSYLSKETSTIGTMTFSVGLKLVNVRNNIMPVLPIKVGMKFIV